MAPRKHDISDEHQAQATAIEEAVNTRLALTETKLWRATFAAFIAMLVGATGVIVVAAQDHYALMDLKVQMKELSASEQQTQVALATLTARIDELRRERKTAAL